MVPPVLVLATVSRGTPAASLLRAASTRYDPEVPGASREHLSVFDQRASEGMPAWGYSLYPELHLVARVLRPALFREGGLVSTSAENPVHLEGRLEFKPPP